MQTFSVYVVEDESSIRKTIYYSLKKKYQMHEFDNAEDAIANLPASPADLIILDVGLPGISGLEALEKIKKLSPKTIVVMCTANDGVDTAISAMKLGAYDYVLKPLNIEKLQIIVENALETVRMTKEIQNLQQKYLQQNMPYFIAESDSILEVMNLVYKAAQSRATILILGESGTGKEIIAQAIHYKSPYFMGPFVALNCAAIPDNLIESELFGYEKGAFSGASATGKKGQLELAANGTLFLDEVGDLHLDAQAKLLRFLEQGEFYRVGGTKKIQLQTRVISATNKNLQEMIETGRFREDLFFRLAIFKVEIPTLNERPKDIIPIAKYYLKEIGANYGKEFQGLSKEVENFLLQHTWRGNIRELKNLIERGVILSPGPILEIQDLGLGSKTTPPPRKEIIEKQEIPPMPESGFPPIPEQGIDLEALEKHYLEEAIRKSQGNDAQAAKLLKMSYYAFRYRKKQLYKQEQNK